ncbi:hypothetical protein MLD38_008006 [Melastoma candidum]|uniref:Uncharacterized protein n=1 Tax=Melastoma candidum TaxID=119954 RepID=A0ACB9RU61_9MYRT|nr:hypothetical protein MLD38_008006 [Melastoma candidum]
MEESRPEREYELPRECWEKIVSFLHPHHLDSLSLVNKLFLSITNSHRTHFSCLSPTFDPSSLLRRFPNITSLCLPAYHGTLLPLLPNLASLSLPDSDGFPLPHSPGPFPKLKSLLLPRLGTLRDHDLRGISRCFPLLEELGVSYPRDGSVTDWGLMHSLLKLKRLRKIDLSGNVFVSDIVVECLSANFPELREIWVKDCFLVSEKCISELVRNRPDLEGLHVSNFGYPAVSSEVTGGFRFARGLKSLGLLSSFVTDDFFGVLADANLPLRELLLPYSNGFTFDGLMELLMNCREIEVLDLKGASFLSDDRVAGLCRVLGNLISVDFSECRGLTDGILHSLARHCPLLREVRMDGLVAVGRADKSELQMDPSTNNGNPNIGVNCMLNFLSLAKASSLNDHFLKDISHMFLNLQHLDISNCGKITEESLSTILNGCGKILHLDISLCPGIVNFPPDMDDLNLEVLVAQGVGFDCTDLGVIARRCPRLRRIDLKSCRKVTTPGVKQLVSSCKLLREVSLQWCNNVDVEVVAWMIFKRPSLRRIVPPKGLVLSKNQKSFFLRHGCLVRDG